MNHPQVTRALIVDISDYEAHKVTGQDADLNGPGNDADLVISEIYSVEIAALTQSLATAKRSKRRRIKRKIRRLKKGRTVSAEVSVRQLSNREATAAKVRTELAGLCKRIEPGGAGLFYRSGHGSVITNDETEADGTCEVFCTYDFLNGHFIQDDEFHQIISDNLHPEAYLYVIADTCNSGDSTRSVGLTRKRGIAMPYKAARTFVNSDQNLPNVTGWMASASDEYAWEKLFGNMVYGAFTISIKPFIRYIVDGSIDWTKAHSAVSRQLVGGDNKDGFQTPQLERYG